MTRKTCFKCDQTKPLEDFYKHKGMKDGRLNKCKDCTRKDTKENRDKNIDHYRAYDRARGSRQPPEYTKEYRMRFPLKYKAHTAVNNAVRDGRLTKEPCEICGETEKVTAHHDDYAKPLEVRWLCYPHHAQWHAENGEAKNAF